MDRDLYLQAFTFALERHEGQLRKDGAPYIVHPLEAAEILRSHGVTDDATLCAALLHDTMEDTKTSYEDVAGCFGDKVAAIVAELTDDKRLPKQQRKDMQVEKAPSLSREAKLVKIADKISNLRSIQRTPPPEWSAERRAGYFAWAGRVFEGLKGQDEALDRYFREVWKRGP